MAMADTFFNDTFTTSTLNQAPGTPTPTSTTYQTYQGTAGGSEAISPGNLTLDFTNTSELCEFVGLFTNTPIALTQPGDFMTVAVVFVNKSNILSGAATANSTIDIGLFNSGGVSPNQGNIVLSTGSTTGGTENWQGYVGRIISSGSAQLYTRPIQTPVSGTSQSQDLLFNGASSTQAFKSPPATSLGSVAGTANTLTQGGTYTEYMSITLNAAGSLLVSNILFVGAGTGGTAQFTQAQTATNATFITAGFNGLAIGWRNSSSASQASCMSISSITVGGQATSITTPPTINTQPLPVKVPNGASAAFTVAATGFNVVYQWHRNGTNLLDGGNISGSTSSTLAISPAGPADVLSGANGYYVTVTGAGNFSTNSVTNSLSFINATNLVWDDAQSPNNNWDLNTTANWQDTNGNQGFNFNFGDPVTFDDNGGGGFVTLVGSYLSPASVTVNSTIGYVLQGTGSLAGPCTLLYEGTGQLTMSSPNTFTGGTIISNASAVLQLQNMQSLGNGPLTFAKAGAKMEITVAASGSTQINGDVNTLDNGTIQVDGVGTFAAVFFGNFSGTSGKTLTFNPKDLTTTNRIRIYGNGMTNNANMVLNGPATTQANYFGTVLAGYEPSGIQLYNGTISGNGGFIQRGSGMTIFAGPNTYTGGTTPSSGAIGIGSDTVGGTGPIGTGALLLAPEIPNVTASGTVLAIGGAHTIANPVQYPSGTNNLTLIVGGTNNLTFSGPMTLNGLDGLSASGIAARILTITNLAATTISGVISDSSSTYSLLKNGAGALYLNGANTFTSPTTNTAGLLSGSGSLAGSVWINTTNASIGGGSAASIGTLTIAGSLNMSGNGYFRVNRSGSASDKVSVTGAINNTGTTGTIVVTNQGATLQVGDRFVLFNKLVTGGANFAVTGGGVNWTDNLGTDGSITVQSIIVPTAPPLTNSFSGGVLTLSWPVANLGWHIEIQTNSLAVGLTTNNWVPSTGTTSVTTTNYPSDPKNPAVFYRLAAPGF